jgi:hypothetical protein
MRVCRSVLTLAVVLCSGCLINTELYEERRDELLAANETGGTYGVRFVAEPDCILVDASELELDGPFSFDAYIAGPSEIPQHDLWPIVAWPGHFAVYQDPYGYTVAGPADEYGPSTGASTTKSIVDTGRHHVAINYGQNGYLSLYIDGEEKGNAPVQFSGEQASNLYIGCWPEQDATFVGVIGEVRLSDSALYAADFEPSWEPYEVSQSTVALWHLDEGEGTEVLDEAGGFDGELVGGSWEHFFLGTEQ